MPNIKNAPKTLKQILIKLSIRALVAILNYFCVIKCDYEIIDYLKKEYGEDFLNLFKTLKRG